jgi:hypothetical protein
MKVKDDFLAYNLMVTAWNVFLIVGIVYLIVKESWSPCTLLWLFIIGGSWRRP